MVIALRDWDKTLPGELLVECSAVMITSAEARHFTYMFSMVDLYFKHVISSIQRTI